MREVKVVLLVLVLCLGLVGCQTKGSKLTYADYVQMMNDYLLCVDELQLEGLILNENESVSRVDELQERKQHIENLDKEKILNLSWHLNCRKSYAFVTYTYNTIKYHVPMKRSQSKDKVWEIDWCALANLSSFTYN